MHTSLTGDPIEQNLDDAEIGLTVSNIEDSSCPVPEPTAERLVRVAHFMSCVDAVDHEQDEIFPRLLNEGMDLAELVDEDVAEVCKVKPSAVVRWSEGSIPRENTRRFLYKYLREQVAEKL